MSVQAYVIHSTIVRCPTPANDFGASLAFDLWDLIEDVRACVALDGEAWDYERSLFRFSPAQRYLFAGLSYLHTIEQYGHDAYFSSALSFGVDDAIACFRTCGSHAVADAIEEAVSLKTAPSIWADGAVQRQSHGSDHMDAAVIQHDPLAALRGFARRHSASFERW